MCLLASLALVGCISCTEAPSSGTTSTEGVEFEQVTDQTSKPVQMSRTEPVLVQTVDAAPRKDAAFALVELIAIENPRSIPIVFELYLTNGEGKQALLGSVAPFPAGRPDSYIIRLDPIPNTGDQLELRMTLSQPDADGDVSVSVAPVRFVTREEANARR